MVIAISRWRAGSGGYATVEIEHPDGMKRTIFFVDGKQRAFRQPR
jgi:hypothetical protein